MSNPHGTDSDEPEPQPERAGSGEAPAADSDPVTDVIDLGPEPGADPDTDPDTGSGTGSGTGPGAPGERRYTAPGFDAGSTQIIDRVPDSPTEFIAVGGRTAGPQAIAPRAPSRRLKRWRTPMALLIAGLFVVVIGGAVLLARSAGPNLSQEDMVRSAIQTFDTAVQQGDLATLRTITCGQTRDNYASYDDQSWTDTYTKVLAAKQYPVVASIDEVVVNGDHAEANVTSYMAFDPATRSTRSFDLQFRDEQWKICQAF